jgi:hypothetical protein
MCRGMLCKVIVEPYLVEPVRSTTFGLSAISVFLFADAEKQRVRAALRDRLQVQIKGVHTFDLYL